MEQKTEPRPPFSKEENILNLKYLQLGTPLAEGSCITLGDMHGNAHAFLHLLAYHGYFAFQSSEEELALRTRIESLQALYWKKPEHYTRADFELMQKDIQRLEFRPNTSLRLMGDLLADRGKNDLMTLLVIKRLLESAVGLEIIFSNHDSVLLQALEAPLREDSTFDFSFSLHAKKRRSAEAINVFIRRGWLPLQAFKTLINTYYKPFVKLVGYAKLGSQEYIYTHAPCDLTQIKILIHFFIKNQFLSKALQETSMEEQIYAVNAFFRQCLEKNTLSSFTCKREAFRKDLEHNTPFRMIYDSRAVSELCYAADETMIYVCGHTIPASLEQIRLTRHVFLDNILGKAPKITQAISPYISSRENLARLPLPVVESEVLVPGLVNIGEEVPERSSQQRRPTPIRSRFFKDTNPYTKTTPCVDAFLTK